MDFAYIPMPVMIASNNEPAVKTVRVDQEPWHCLADVYSDCRDLYPYDCSLPIFTEGTIDPEGYYRGRCQENGCSCRCYRFEGHTTIRCSMCDHTPFQHTNGRPPFPKTTLERMKSNEVTIDPEFQDRPVGKSFSVV